MASDAEFMSDSRERTNDEINMGIMYNRDLCCIRYFQRPFGSVRKQLVVSSNMQSSLDSIHSFSKIGKISASRPTEY